MTESKWIVSKWLRQGEQIGRDERGKETAHEMFIDGKNIMEIRKYSKLQDDDLADVLRGLPTDIQRKYLFGVVYTVNDFLFKNELKRSVVKMKRFVSAFVIFMIIFFSLNILGFAWDDIELKKENIKESLYVTDIDEITKLFPDLIIYLNNAIDDGYMYANENEKIKQEYIELSDINVSDMYKIYYDVTDIFNKNIRGEDLIEYLNNSDYFWVLPIFKNNQVYEINFAKGFPLNEEAVYALDDNGNRILTDEEIQKIKDEVGKWTITMFGGREYDYATEAFKCYEMSKEKLNIKNAINDTMYFIQLPEFRTCAALIIMEHQNYFKLFHSYSDIMKNQFVDGSIINDELVNLSNNESEFGAGGGVNINKIDMSTTPEPKNEMINNSKYVILIFSIIIFTATIIIYIYKIKTSQKYKTFFKN